MKLIRESGFDELMARWNALGVVIECVPFVLDGADGCSRGVHRAAALATLGVLKDQSDSYFDAVLASPEYADRKRENFFMMTIDADALGEGEPVEKVDFLGPYCDLDGRRLLMRGTMKNHRNDLFWFGDAEMPRNRVPLPTRTHSNGSFADAYLDPPYSLSGTRTDCNAAFIDALDLLFDGLHGDCTIFRWSDASSNYFDGGREWWGTYFWTVHAAGTDRIVGCVASATD
jgi:hypothetical protein